MAPRYKLKGDTEPSDLSDPDLAKSHYKPLLGPNGAVLAEFEVSPTKGDWQSSIDYLLFNRAGKSWADVYDMHGHFDVSLELGGTPVTWGSYDALDSDSFASNGEVTDDLGVDVSGGLYIDPQTFALEPAKYFRGDSILAWLQILHGRPTFPLRLQDAAGTVLASFGSPAPGSAAASASAPIPTAPSSAVQAPCSAGQTMAKIYGVFEPIDTPSFPPPNSPAEAAYQNSVRESWANTTLNVAEGNGSIGSIPCGMEVAQLQKYQGGNMEVRLPNGIVCYIITSTGKKALEQWKAARNAKIAAERRQLAERAAERQANLHQYALPEKELAKPCDEGGSFSLNADFLGKGDSVDWVECNQPVYLIRDTVTGRELMTQKGDIGFEVDPELTPVAKPADVVGIRSLGYRTSEGWVLIPQGRTYKLKAD